MASSHIQPGVELYYAAGREWKVVPPTKATVVSAEPYRIVRRRQGAFYLVSWQPDPAGNAVLVDLDEPRGVRRTAVPRRDLHGPWLETLAKLGRTFAGVKAHRARIADIASRPGPIALDAVLQVAACDEGLPDDVFTTLVDHAGGEGA